MDGKIDCLFNLVQILSLINFADALWERRVGSCNYAKYKLTNAQVEAGNVSIGLSPRSQGY
ncbi:hypothetical protein EDB38_12427 [Vibrio crassostreae]|nr:hypothetical protein EDB35_1321 [Vibrio crassostreae]TCN95671.1 hypothetical protein EDB30_12151 [Vibrio crassostreae]TCT46101.1 hypothetical protein EDB42_12322 [Vibrio crassostreae]TCT70569.1 hypothetical protein EDB41_12327 [Vibrio crassostreae]TCT89927.1 hypothetical protein EDB38_12427 [Vibrio crassostreae]